MAERSRPWTGADPDKKVANEAQHRAFLGRVLGNGVINARDESKLKVVADGTGVLRLLPGEYLIDGLYYELDADKTFNVTGTPTPPQGQSRIDYLVMRLNPTEKVVTAELKIGAPSVNPQPPALSRPVSTSGTDVVEELLAEWPWTGQGLTQQQIRERRTFNGPSVVVAVGTPLPPATLGARARQGAVEYVGDLVTNSQGNRVADWVEVLDVTPEREVQRLLCGVRDTLTAGTGSFLPRTLRQGAHGPVQLIGTVRTPASAGLAAGLSILTVPTDHRPNTVQFVPLMDLTANTALVGEIATSGVLECRTAIPAGRTVAFNSTYYARG